MDISKMVTIKKLTVVILVLVLVLAYLLIRENQTKILVVRMQTELLPKPERKDDYNGPIKLDKELSLFYTTNFTLGELNE